MKQQEQGAHMENNENTTEQIKEAAEDFIGKVEEAVESGAEATEEVVDKAVAGAEKVVDEMETSVAPEAEESERDEVASEAAQDDNNEVDEPETADATKPDENGDGLQRGDVLEGVIKETSPMSVTVDLGNGREGVVPGRELELMTRKMLESLQSGETVLVYVVNPRNHKNETILSINLALEELDWRKVEEYRQSKEIYEDRISGYNKGGLIVRFGRLRGFVPKSQIADIRLSRMAGDTPEQQYGQFVGEPISVKVMEVDRRRNRLIFSERAAIREARQQQKEALVSELREGEIREGRVVSLESFGAFVDIGGAEGLVHLTELSWTHITHPRQTLSVGDRVKVKVINLDPEQNRIGLSIRQLQADPWDNIATSFKQGQLVRGAVTKLSSFGAFVQLDEAPDVEGLVHISELSDERVDHPREVVNRGDILTLRVIKIDVKNRRLGLSLKRVNSAEYLDLDMEMAFSEEDG